MFWILQNQFKTFIGTLIIFSIMGTFSIMGNKKQFEHLRKAKKENKQYYSINWIDGTTTYLNKETNKIETIKTRLL